MLGSSFRVALRAATCIVAFAIAGCGPRMYPVHGKVTLPGGQPAANTQVLFETQSDGKVISARGDVQADGSFVMSTNKPGDGVPAGKYRVQVNPPPMLNAEAAPVSLFNRKYEKFDSSGLEFEVGPGKSNEFLIEVTK